MIFILLGCIWLLMLIFTFINPPVALLVYSVLASDRDAFGISEFLNGNLHCNKFIMRGFLIVVFLVSTVKLTLVLMKRPLGFNYIGSVIAIILSLIIFVTSLLKGFSIFESLSFLAYSGVPIFIVWISTENKKEYRLFFIIFISIQIIISSMVISFPTLNFIDGRTYKITEGFVDVASSAVNFSLPGVQSNKYLLIKYGQFHNPNGLGFYSCISIVLGFFLFMKKKHKKTIKLFGLFIVFLGLMCWLNSLTRGPFAAVFLLVFMWLFVFPFLERFKGGGYVRLMKCVLVFFVFIFLFIIFYGYFGFIIPDLSNVSVTSRIDGYLNGLTAVSEYPFLGIDRNWVWPSVGSNPHFLPLAFAAEHGILSGFLVFILVYLMGVYAIFIALTKVYLSAIDPINAAYAIGLILIVLSIATTNNITSTVLFWVCLAEAYIITFTSSAESL